MRPTPTAGGDEDGEAPGALPCGPRACARSLLPLRKPGLRRRVLAGGSRRRRRVGRGLPTQAHQRAGPALCRRPGAPDLPLLRLHGRRDRGRRPRRECNPFRHRRRGQGRRVRLRGDESQGGLMHRRRPQGRCGRCFRRRDRAGRFRAAGSRPTHKGGVLMAVHEFDLVILGSGSTAFAAALRAAELGKTAAMTESRVLGGTCVNRGCLPSKNLIEAARLVFQAGHPSYPGLAPAPVEVDYEALIGQKDTLVEEYRGRKYQSIVSESEAIRVFAGEAHLEADLRVRVGDDILVGERVLVATGTRPHLPSIPGLESIPFLTSDLLGAGVPEELTERPASLLLLGGGYVALELGQLFSRLGTRVTILERGPELLHRMEPEVGPALREAFAAEGIEVLTRAHVQEVAVAGLGVGARVRIGGEERPLEAERLLVATGRDANTRDLGLHEAGVELDDTGFVRVDEYLRTSKPRVYAA